MEREYRVMDCRTPLADPFETKVRAGSPEEAARLAIGEDLLRGGRPADLRARVYFQDSDQPLTMVRLYSKAIDRS